MEQKAQVSFEYILTVSLAIILVIAVMIIALQVVSIADLAKTKILQNRYETIESLLS